MIQQLVMYEEELHEINRICETLHRDSNAKAVLVIDKNIKALSRVSDRHYILEKGRTVWTGTSSDLMRNDELRHRLLSA